MTASRRCTRSLARWGWRTFTGALASIVMASTAGCAGGPSTSRAVPEGSSEARAPAPELSAASRYLLAITHIQQEDFDAATRELAELAKTCESGLRGRDAVLILASLELDPRNAGGSPSSAARLAARYLQIRKVPSVAVAEALYLLAVDLGGEPVTDPLAQSPGDVRTALAFENCDAQPEPVLVREIPSHPGPLTTRTTLVRASAQRDALAAVADSLALRAAELEAELDRIRRLLSPDSVAGRDDTPSPRRP